MKPFSSLYHVRFGWARSQPLNVLHSNVLFQGLLGTTQGWSSRASRLDVIKCRKAGVRDDFSQGRYEDELELIDASASEGLCP